MTGILEKPLEQGIDALFTMFTHTGVRPTTLHLIWLLMLDLPLTPGAIVDFGVDSPQHYQALQAVIHTTVPVSLVLLGKELDQALGNGSAIAALVQKYAPAYKDVSFKTVWDELSF